MKLALALFAIAGCAAAFISRVVRVLAHRKKGGHLMRRRVFGSVGVGLASLGWAAAVLPLVGIVKRGPRLDWVLLVVAAVVSCFMAWTLWKADQVDRSGGLTDRQREAAEDLERVRREVAGLPTAMPDEDDR